jgi:NitT/TauT family transport system ATP-binding protein
MEALTDELEKVVREELGHAYSLKKNPISNSSADHMGVGI